MKKISIIPKILLSAAFVGMPLSMGALTMVAPHQSGIVTAYAASPKKDTTNTKTPSSPSPSTGGSSTTSNSGSSSTLSACPTTPTSGTVTNCIISSGTSTSAASIINEKFYQFGQLIAGIVFGVAFLIIIYAGFKYASSQGDPKTTESAKMQIVSAAIGCGIALLAYVILSILQTVLS